MNNLLVEPPLRIDTPVKTDYLEQLKDSLFSIIPGIEAPGSVPVLQAEALTEEVFREEWVSKNRPCLVKGAVKHWPAVEKCKDKDYWISHCKNSEVTVYPHQN